MMRLILFVFLLAAVALALAAVMTMIRSFGPQTATTNRDAMPKTLSRTAYVLLIILMFGVTSGLLGAT